MIVVDNGSADGSADTVATLFPAVTVVRPFRNLGFAGGANAGAKRAEGELLLFLNPDVRVAPGCLGALRKSSLTPMSASAHRGSIRACRVRWTTAPRSICSALEDPASRRSVPNPSPQPKSKVR